jgi:S1-C subfamily serine protease
MVFHRDALSNVVCNIRIPTANGEEVGTGIFIEKDNQPYLLTAAHVIKNLNNNAYVIFSDLNGLPTKVLMSVLLGGTTFDIHPEADLAKAKIILSAVNGPYLSQRCFPYKQIDTGSNLLSKDLELTTIGFPLGLGSTRIKIFTINIQDLCCNTCHYPT